MTPTLKEARALADDLTAFANGCRRSMWQSRDETILLMDKGATALTAMVDELERLREYALKVTKALTGLTVGGSEFFRGDKLGFYEADISACIKNIKWRLEQREKMGAAKAVAAREALKGADQ